MQEVILSRKATCLSTLYGLVSVFFLGNFYSWGLHQPFFFVLSALILCAPVYGMVSVILYARVLSWMLGKTPGEVIPAILWSKLPYVVSLAMWLLVFVSEPNLAFVHSATVFSSSIILISTAVYFCSFCLLVRAIPKSLISVICSNIAIFILSVIIMLLVRYIFLITIN